MSAVNSPPAGGRRQLRSSWVEKEGGGGVSLIRGGGHSLKVL